jgi:TPR repeat protein
MEAVSLQTAIVITGKSRRTLWRRIEEADLRRDAEANRNKTLLDGNWVRQNSLLDLDDEEWGLVLAADGGDAEAQNEVGVLFLEAQMEAAALYWFEQAAAQNHADALHWLAHCHVTGKGAPENHALGMMYLARAANLGHVIANEQLSAIQRSVLR